MHSTYTTYRSEGGLLPEDILVQLLESKEPDQRAKAFGFSAEAELEAELNRAWTEARSAWKSLQLSLHRVAGSDTGATRDQWLRPLLRVLGYELVYQNQAATVNESGETYHISHRCGGPEGLPVHLVGFSTPLGQKAKGQKRSPYAMVQEYLNRSDHVWALLSNGAKLWLLRATQRVARPSFIEWDLAAMMDGGLYDDFRALYRLCHVSRFPLSVDAAPTSWIEQYASRAHSEGGRIRDGLRDGVKQALDTLGSGFLQHPDNAALRSAAASGVLSAGEYYRELLRLIYRLLFLMVAEERHLLLPDSDDSSPYMFIYEEAFGMERLRRLVDHHATRSMPSGFSDLWQGLLSTFELFASHPDGESPLPIPALNGQLFSASALPHLMQAGLENHVLLAALRPITVLPGEERRRVNYAALDVEELGSVYESLLDYTPQWVQDGERWAFELSAGSDRKSTGSYYTPPELVGALIESSLSHLIEERKREPDPVSALLSLTVCDPACGSGHFLLAAARAIARAVAQARFQEQEPTPDQFRVALREVIEHSIYGVDKNPLAVDLCKVALWIEGHTPGQPLSFLDHRIRLGDSLVGVFDLQAPEVSVPDGAFLVKTGDDKAPAQRLKKRNTAEKRGVQHFESLDPRAADSWQLDALAQSYNQLDRMKSDSVDAVHAKESQYQQSRDLNPVWQRDWQRANLAVAPFFAELTPDNEMRVPTTVHLQQAARDQEVSNAVVAYANQLAREHHFFHWPLEFPEVFHRGGFDAVLGNPPWERVKLQQKEWFQARRPEVARAANRARRVESVERLQAEDPALWREFQQASHEAEAASGFARTSGRFPFGGVGDVNTYALFAELARDLMGPQGMAGVVVPTAIATDYTYRDFFGDLLKQRQLRSLYDFENRAKLFPGVHSSYKFGLLTLDSRPVERAHFGFFLEHVEDMRDRMRVFDLTRPDLVQVNPNTATCPVFRTRADAEITAGIYRRVPVLINEGTHENPWGIQFSRMMDMANDSHLFRSEPGPDRVPLYEAKMMHQFDHRWGTYDGGQVRDTTDAERSDPDFRVTPHYWVDKREVEERVPTDWHHQWFIGFRNITNATNERTVLAAVVPWAGAGDELPLVFPCEGSVASTTLMANLNSIATDYVARQKVGGTHLSYFLLKQFPILPPEAYSPADVAFITQRVVELVYTAWELQPFARDIGYDGAPFAWDPDRRAVLRAELDGYYAHLYGLSRTELQYILDPQSVKGSGFPGKTFPTLKRGELRAYGEYRTERLVLAAYDALAYRFQDRKRTQPAG